MRFILILGLLLMALATTAFVVGDFSITSSTKVVDGPSVQVSARQERRMRMPVFLDAALFLGGLAMVVLGARGN